jgi:hypothetical protein
MCQSMFQDNFRLIPKHGIVSFLNRNYRMDQDRCRVLTKLLFTKTKNLWF